jgi:hypothetical protein
LSLAFSFSFIKNIVNHFEITKLLLDRTYRHTKGNLRLDELGGGNITASIWLLNYVTTKQLLVVVVHNNKCTTTIRFFNQVAPHCPTNVEIVSYTLLVVLWITHSLVESLKMICGAHLTAIVLFLFHIIGCSYDLRRSYGLVNGPYSALEHNIPMFIKVISYSMWNLLTYTSTSRTEQIGTWT